MKRITNNPVDFSVRALAVLGVFIFAFAVLNNGYLSTAFGYDDKNTDQELAEIDIIEQNQINSNSEIVKIEDAKPKAEQNKIIIPKIKVDAPIVHVSRINEDVFQDALMLGVVHYPQTAALGEVGNAFIFGHSSDLAWKKNPYQNVFALVPELEINDLIYVSDGEGTQFKYKVTDTFVVSPKDTHVLDQNTDGKRILTLQTSYPVGTAISRYIVVSELVEE